MKNKSKDLVINKSPKSLFAESIRSIRTNIAFASIDKDVKIIMNTSPELLNYKDDIELEKYIFPTFDENIDLLPTGPLPPNPVELLGSENNKKLLERLKKHYDLILLDCAPILGLSDSLILASLADIRLVTVSSRKTKMEGLERVQKLFEQTNLKIDGVILNNAKMNSSHYYSRYYTNSYYGEDLK